MVIGKKKTVKVKKSHKRQRMSSDEMYSDMTIDPVGDSEDRMWDFIQSNMEAIAEKLMQSQGMRCLTEQVEELTENLKVSKNENELLRKRLAIAEGTIIRSERTLSSLEEKIKDLTARSMRDNVILKNMPEYSDETADSLEQRIMSFFEKDLNIHPDKLVDITIERAHRFGKAAKGKPRQVVAKLSHRGKSVVMAHVKNLSKTSNIKISEQFPPEMHSNRNKLWPDFVKAKQEGRRVKWKQDELVVDGRTMKPRQDVNTDINMDISDAALKLTIKHTAIETKDGNSFQGHAVQIKSADDVIPAIKALCADFRISGASHVSYAYRVGNQNHSFHNWEDDGEWGGGRTIMERIKETGSFNTLICVTHWCGTRALGEERFACIKSVADAALDATRSS